jgi:hypothetical protein
MTLRSLGIVTMIGICAFAPAAAAEEGRPAQLAQAAPPEQQPVQGRDLGGHRFVPSELLVQPFVETAFRAVTAFGLVRSTAPDLSVAGDQVVTGRRFTQVGYSQTFELQMALLPWLAVRAAATSVVFSGVNRRSVLNLGSTIQYGAGGGVTIGHRLGDAVQIALVADAAYEPTYSVDIGGAIAASLRAQQVDTAPLLTRERGVPLQAGVAVAFAPAAAVGVTVMGRYEHTFHGSGGLERQDAAIAAGALDLDLRALTTVPIGFLAAYQLAIPFGDNDRTDLWYYFDGGFFYTAKRDLVLGMEGSVRRFPQRQQVDSDALVGNVVVRYYW